MAFPRFITPRLLLRPMVAEDIHPLFALIYNDPMVRQFFTNLETWDAVAMVHQATVAANDDPANRGFGHWTVTERSSGTVLGKVLLEAPAPAPWIVLDDRSPHAPVGMETELAYALGRAFWGHGYAFEACQALLPHIFETLALPRVMNSVRRANTASIRLMEKLGFQLESQRERPEFVIGVLTQLTYADTARTTVVSPSR
ncbi:GNAT family N-acetyltransferase [Herpetosiphon geysericola]|uniref:N-acetyltransferase domain-containing protein n=1 Tax=Herpetosiphon geysericola TaxID=70996 RepID=A0A0P6YB63_9CHLR|nr:GNAT family N-acetyltransferase [Herpetosiphon geysericola]KPL86653.1 hypothetical protein SE18_11705 [Herpetosiphon geysericola]